MALGNVNQSKNHRQLRDNQKLYKSARHAGRDMTQHQVMLKAAKLRGKLEQGQGNLGNIRSRLRGFRHDLRQDVLGRQQFNNLKGDPQAMRQAIKRQLGAKKFSAAFQPKGTPGGIHTTGTLPGAAPPGGRQIGKIRGRGRPGLPNHRIL